MGGDNPVFRSIEARAHGVLGLSAVDRTVIVTLGGLASMASPVLGGVVAALTLSALLTLRRLDAQRRDHLALRLRRTWGRRRYDPRHRDPRWQTPSG